MDWQLVIALNLMVVSVMFAVVALRFRFPGYLTTLAIHALVIGCGLAAWYLRPDVILWAVAIPFVPLVAFPALVGIAARRAEQRGDFESFQARLRWLSWLRTRKDNDLSVELGRATHLATDADVDRALATLSRRAASDDDRLIVEATRAAFQGDWPSALQYAERARDPYLLARTLLIRAYGEAGRIDDMARAYEQAKTRLLGSNHADAQLFLFAFSGRTDAVARLLQGPLKHYPPETSRFWLARARLRADRTDATASAALEVIARTAGRDRTRAAALRALAETVPPLSAAADAQIAAIENRRLRDEARRPLPLQRLYATLLLTAVNLGMFAVSAWTGNSEDLRHLWTLGALWPPSIARNGEWWRLATATVLHFGPIHLTANMLMLYVFGRTVETRLGSLLTLAFYGLAAIGSTAFVYALMLYDVIDDGVLVGASGAIFGLVGISLALDLADWLVTRDRLDRARVGSLFTVLLLQAAIDNAVPGISFAGHASGLAIGLVLGGLFALWQRHRDARKIMTS